MRKPPRLTCELLLHAYSIGFFPMADEGTGEIRWYSPEPRAVIPIETYRPWRSLRQVLRKDLFEVRIDGELVFSHKEAGRFPEPPGRAPG